MQCVRLLCDVSSDAGIRCILHEEVKRQLNRINFANHDEYYFLRARVAKVLRGSHHHAHFFSLLSTIIFCRDIACVHCVRVQPTKYIF